MLNRQVGIEIARPLEGVFRQGPLAFAQKRKPEWKGR